MPDTVPRHVFRPGAIGTLELANRIVMGAMHLNLERRPDGGAAMAAFYAERVRGGVGLIVTGGCAVNQQGSGGLGYAVISDPAQHRSLAQWAAAVHAEGGRIALQLFHAGRYTSRSSTGLVPLAPSAVPSRLFPDPPDAMDSDQIAATVEDFARAAATARELGFDGIEVMGSEGYLINQFLSPLTNLREDEWGGDARRRLRFPLEVVRAISTAAPGFPLLFRMSGNDLMPGSSTPDEHLRLAVELVSGGVDAINVGVGWHESRIPTVQAMVPPGVWVRYAAAIKQELVAAGSAVPVIASNRINRMELAEQVLAEGHADFVSMSRPLLADPAIVRKAQAGERHAVNTCIACNEACVDRSLGEEPVSCMVNPRAGRELGFPVRPTRRARHYAVLGGGPSGLEAARALGALGHQVDLFESADQLGGQFRMARLVPGKEDFGSTVRFFTAELARLGVRTHLCRPVTDADEGLLLGFDGAVLATGVLPRRIDVPGVDLPHVVDYRQAFADPSALGSTVAIIGGGGIAVDLAHLLGHVPGDLDPRDRFLAEHGLLGPARTFGSARRITVLRRRGRIGSGMGRTTRWAAIGALRGQGAELLSDVRYEAVVPEGVRIVDANGTRRLIAADSVVVAAGQVSCDGLRAVLERSGTPYRVVGGAADAEGLNAVRAFDEGLRAAYDLATPELSDERDHLLTGCRGRSSWDLS